MRRFHVLLGAMVAGGCLSSAVGGVNSPRMTTRIIAPLAEVSEHGRKVAVVSNIERVELEFTVARAVRGEASTTENIQPSFNISAISQSDEAPIVVKHSLIGVSGNGNRVSVRLFIELPIEDAERRQLISTYVDELIASSTGKVKEALRDRREATIASFEQAFVQSRVGEFTVIIDVHDPRVGALRGEVPVRIIHKGTFIDKYRLRQTTGRAK